MHLPMNDADNREYPLIAANKLTVTGIFLKDRLRRKSAFKSNSVRNVLTFTMR
jgi:hypothetical protein